MASTAHGAYEFCEGHIMPPMGVAMVLQGICRAVQMVSNSSVSAQGAVSLMEICVLLSR
jgi:hypothetical protein